MIPERQREALMRLTMCARKECAMCIYHGNGFPMECYEVQTNAMNTLADALRVADTPQTTLCRECDDYAGDGMYCASNYLVRDFSTSAENCEKEETADTPQTDCGWK